MVSLGPEEFFESAGDVSSMASMFSSDSWPSGSSRGRLPCNKREWDNAESFHIRKTYCGWTRISVSGLLSFRRTEIVDSYIGSRVGNLLEVVNTRRGHQLFKNASMKSNDPAEILWLIDAWIFSEKLVERFADCGHYFLKQGMVAQVSKVVERKLQSGS